jgi:transcriptional regulator with XRE-family HTH domain
VSLHVVARRSREYAEFLDRLRRARASARLTQAETARRLGRPQSYVSKSESGERRVDVVELTAFARTYAVPISFFVGGAEAAYGARTRAGLRRVAEAPSGRKRHRSAAST